MRNGVIGEEGRKNREAEDTTEVTQLEVSWEQEVAEAGQQREKRALVLEV